MRVTSLDVEILTVAALYRDPAEANWVERACRYLMCTALVPPTRRLRDSTALSLDQDSVPGRSLGISAFRNFFAFRVFCRSRNLYRLLLKRYLAGSVVPGGESA